FWSRNSMTSSFVRSEWEYALSLNRASFIRPVYWEVPMPESPDLGLPPDTLRALHFHRILFESRSSAGPTEKSLTDTPPPGVKKGDKDIFDDTDFEVDVTLSDDDSDDKTMQLEAASDFELEESDSASEVFAIDEDAVDQSAATGWAPAAFAEEEDEEDDGFESSGSGEMASAWSSSD